MTRVGSQRRKKKDILYHISNYQIQNIHVSKAAVAIDSHYYRTILVERYLGLSSEYMSEFYLEIDK
jgi:hypothetical protein